MTRLVWSEATYRDKKHLQKFKCCHTELRMEISTHGFSPVHDRLHEFVVQEAIQDLKPPIKNGCVLLGSDDEGLAAVQVIRETEAAASYDLAYAAVALRHRHPRDHPECGVVADEMLTNAHEWIVSRAIDRGHEGGFVQVTALIDTDNHASQRMVERAGILRYKHTEGELQVWEGELPVPGQPLF